jgi:hypothetical protein
MKHYPLMGLALALTMPLLCATRPAAAAEIKAIAQAVGSNDPLTISWADSADGKLTLDDDLSALTNDMFSGAQYILTEDGQLLLGHLNGNSLDLIVPAAAQIHNDKNDFFIVHVRSADRNLFLDGSITRYSDDPTKGYAEFTLLLIGKQGGTVSTHIEQSLTFPAAGSSPGTGVTNGASQ